MFKKYPHLERFGMDGVSGIELGHCYIFPKLDGTNAQVWIDEDQYIQAGITEEDAIELRKENWMVEEDSYLACFV